MKRVLLGIALLTVLLPVFAFAGPAETKAPGGSITGKTVWAGRVLVSGPVRVEAGASLVIRPGTSVRFAKGSGLEVAGILKAEGRKGGSITLTSAEGRPAPGDWTGISFVEAKEGTVLKNCAIAYAGSVTVGGCSPSIRDCTIKDGTQGVVLARKSSPSLSGNVITDIQQDGIQCQMGSSPAVNGNRVERCGANGIFSNKESQPTITGNTVSGCKTGIRLSQPLPPVEKNVLKDNETGIYISSAGNSLIIRGNRIQDNKTGVVCWQNAGPTVEGNDITGNSGAGVYCAKFSSPVIFNNDIAGNGQGISCVQLCNPRIYANDIHDNKTGVYLDLSSYAMVNGNNIYDNKVQFELGNMSSDWEAKANKKPIRGAQAQNMTLINRGRMPVKRAGEGSGIMGYVDATANWWGQKDTDEMDKKGPDANMDAFVDYHDVPTRTYEGYTGVYVQDRIKYDGWKAAKIKNAGIKAAGRGTATWSGSGSAW